MTPLDKAVQDDTEWMVALAIAPGLDLKELQPYHLLPSPVCANTTSSHWACTISHLMLLLEAYEQGEVCTWGVSTCKMRFQKATCGHLTTAPNFQDAPAPQSLSSAPANSMHGAHTGMMLADRNCT